MASELKVDKFTGVTTAGSILVTGEGNSTTTNLQQGLAKVWGQYNHDTETRNDDFNVDSITDGGSGIYSINFVNNMANDNYSVSGCGVAAYYISFEDSDGEKTSAGISTAHVKTRWYAYDGGITDMTYSTFNVHGDLA